MAGVLKIKSGTKLQVAFDAALGEQPNFNMVCTFNKSLDELGIPYIKEKEDEAKEEDAPRQHLEPKDREQIYREKNSKKS